MNEKDIVSKRKGKSSSDNNDDWETGFKKSAVLHLVSFSSN